MQLDDDEARGCVWPGWHAILAELHKQLVAVDPDYSVGQVKQKFGGLRVYLDSTYGPRIHELISAAEAEAWRTCEFCGGPGKAQRTSPHGWMFTACDPCAAEKTAGPAD